VARGPARLRSEFAPPPPGDPGALPAASDPGPSGPVRPRRSASWASWARAGLYGSSGRRGLRTHQARTSYPDRQPDRPGLGWPRHVADSSGGARGHLGPLRCRQCGHVAISGARLGPRPAGVTVTWGTRGGAVLPFSSALWVDRGLSANGIQSYSRMWLNRCRRMNLQCRHPLCLVPAKAPTGSSQLSKMPSFLHDLIPTL
jgi:hypothetical protein